MEAANIHEGVSLDCLFYSRQHFKYLSDLKCLKVILRSSKTIFPKQLTVNFFTCSRNISKGGAIAENGTNIFT